jgi:hypothetical protein
MRMPSPCFGYDYFDEIAELGRKPFPTTLNISPPKHLLVKEVIPSLVFPRAVMAVCFRESAILSPFAVSGLFLCVGSVHCHPVRVSMVRDAYKLTSA